MERDVHSTEANEGRDDNDGEDDYPDALGEHMTTMHSPAAAVKVEYPAVKCPRCPRSYIGAFIGKAQCKSCGCWVTVDSQAIADVGLSMSGRHS